MKQAEIVDRSCLLLKQQKTHGQELTLFDRGLRAIDRRDFIFPTNNNNNIKSEIFEAVVCKFRNERDRLTR